MRQTGTVKFFNQAKGFGFITPDEGGKDVFVHISAVERSGVGTLDEGMRVTYETQPDPKGKGPKAVDISSAPNKTLKQKPAGYYHGLFQNTPHSLACVGRQGSLTAAHALLRSGKSLHSLGRWREWLPFLPAREVH